MKEGHKVNRGIGLSLKYENNTLYVEGNENDKDFTHIAIEAILAEDWVLVKE